MRTSRVGAATSGSASIALERAAHGALARRVREHDHRHGAARARRVRFWITDSMPIPCSPSALAMLAEHARPVRDA